jgi:hypothetical protein
MESRFPVFAGWNRILMLASNVCQGKKGVFCKDGIATVSLLVFSAFPASADARPVQAERRASRLMEEHRTLRKPGP